MEAITYIEVEPPLPGFNRFIGAWLCTGRKNVLIDVGPANTAGTLIRCLSHAGIHRIDYVLLTHIHIDHAGGLARFLEHYPMAAVICHEKAIRHLTAPSKLWKASQQTLGKIAEAYGTPQPVQSLRLIPHTEARLPGLEIIDTPGHASHHLGFSWEGNLFAGEAAGNYCAWEGSEYLRPATPPRFFKDVFLASIDRLSALEDQPICYAHAGRATSSHEMLTRFRLQILRWEDLIREECLGQGKNKARSCVDILLEADPELRRFGAMNTDTQNRERYFIGNSVKGFIGFLSG